MKTMTVAEFNSALKAQGVARDDLAFKCPMCSTIQSLRMLKFAKPNAADTFYEGQIGFSCVGRLTNAGPFDAKKRRPQDGCDWTLGGLFQIHKLTVIDDVGRAHPSFEIASPEEAKALAERLQNAAVAS